MLEPCDGTLIKGIQLETYDLLDKRMNLWFSQGAIPMHREYDMAGSSSSTLMPFYYLLVSHNCGGLVIYIQYFIRPPVPRSLNTPDPGRCALLGEVYVCLTLGSETALEVPSSHKLP